MSLILNALRRLEAKAPPEAAVAVEDIPPSLLEDLCELPLPSEEDWDETALPLPSGEGWGEGESASGHDAPPVFEPPVLESVELGLADALSDWADRPEICLSGADLTRDDIEEHILVGGELQLPDLIDIVEATEQSTNPDLPVGSISDAEIPAEVEAPPEPIADEVFGPEIFDEPAAEEIQSLELPAEVIADEVPVDEAPADEDILPLVPEEVAELETPQATILPFADFRAQEAAKKPEEHLLPDRETLAAQLNDLEYRGLRDNVLSQLPDGPSTLLLAAPDDEVDVAEVATRLAEVLARLELGSVAVVLSDELPASPSLSAADIHRDPFEALRSHRQVSTITIDASESASLLVVELERRHRWVLLAAGPATAVHWSRLCDAVYPVVALGVTDRRAALATIRSLEAAGGRVLGCVLTGVPEVA